MGVLSAYVLGVFTGLGVGVVGNLLYDAIFTPIGSRLIRHRIEFKVSGNRHPSVNTDVCGLVCVRNSR